MKEQKYEVRVRFNETDGLGHVSNISYFIYLENARIEFLRVLGEPMDMKDWSFIVASTSCDYKQQGYFDEIFIVDTVVSRIGNSSFELKHYIGNERGNIAIGKAVLVYFNFQEQKSVPLTEEMRETLETYFAEQ